MPTLLEGLTEVDVLHIAFGCRFALDMFTILQQLSPTPNHEPLPRDPEFAIHFEHGCYTRLKTDLLASLLGPRSWKGTHTLSLSVWVELVVTQCHSRHVDSHRSCTARFELTTVSIHDTHDLPVQTLSAHHSVLVCFPHRSLCARFISPWFLSLGVCLCRVHPCAPRAQMAVMVIPRTHCHFLMQARALRVPELCDDHTLPSCLVTNSLAKSGYRSVNTLVFPDPWLTQGAPVTLPACALHQLFVMSCDLAHHGLYCSHVYVCTHHRSSQHLHFRCLSLLFSRAHMDGPQCTRLPLGTTEWNHSYCTASSLSALHSLQQLQAGASSPSPVQMSSASTRQSHDAALSSFCALSHRPRSVLPIHRFGRAPPALSQMTFCQLRSLRLPRNSPLLPSCIINTVSLFFNGIQDRPAGTPLILSRRPVEFPCGYSSRSQ